MTPKNPTSPPFSKPRKRKFSGTRKPREHYDRKVITYGYSRSLSLGRVIPKDWKYVRIHVLKKENDYIELGIECLLKEKNQK